MYGVEERHPGPPQPPPLSMDRIPPPSSSYPTPGSAGPMGSAGPPHIPSLAPVSTIHEGRIWSLQVVQQPIRARMCGFGDKVRSRLSTIGVSRVSHHAHISLLRIDDPSRLPHASGSSFEMSRPKKRSISSMFRVDLCPRGECSY